MPRDNIPPEERLLRLIRGQEKARDPVAPQASVTTPVKRLAACPKKISFKPSIKNIIFAALFLSSFYLATVFLSPVLFPERLEVPPAEPVKDNMVQSLENKQARQPLEHYLSAVQGRDIFVKQSVRGEASAPGIIAADLIKDMNLVGIVSGADPQAIIEDKKAQKTYYLRKGQLIGELQVTDIQEGRVIITHNGQKYELSL